MTLTDMAEYVMPKPPAAESLFELLDVGCAMCAGKTIQACPTCDDDIVCATCHQRICVLCGCTDLRACRDGCSWMLPGICSMHDGDVRMARLVAPLGGGRTVIQLIDVAARCNSQTDLDS